jgi:hypothetical protein
MANIEINQLPAATLPLDGTEIIPVDQGASTVQVTVEDVADFIKTNNNNFSGTNSFSGTTSFLGTTTVNGLLAFYSFDLGLGSTTILNLGGNPGTSGQVLTSQGGAATPIWSDVAVLPYKAYTAVISQQGTAAPIVDYILQNNLGGAISFAYSSVGLYSITNASFLFDDLKTIVFINPGYIGAGPVTMGWERNSDSIITLSSKNTTTGADANGLIFRATIEIRVYS